MNDITKARVYFTKRGSKLQHLPSFGLMYRTAEDEYRKLREASAKQDARLPGDFDDREIEAALDYAVMIFMKRYSVLPADVAAAFRPGVTKEDKRDLARKWANA